MRIMLAVVLTAFLLVCRGLEWSNTIPDNDQLELCAGDPVKLHWQFNLSEGERLQGVQWIHSADDGQGGQLVASYEVNNFVPTAEFSGRVSHVGYGGVELSCATILDSGTYSVVVSTLGDVTSVSEHRRAVSVHVNDTPKTRSGELHIHQERKAVRDVTTGHWHVQLTCGHFSDRGHPPVDVIWKTPKGEQLTSSDFHNGSFHLLLPNPIKGGNYSCSLSPPLSPATRCLPRHSALWTDVSVEVEEVDARFLLLEASVQAQVDERTALRLQMQEENQRLLDVIDDLENQTEVLRIRLEEGMADQDPTRRRTTVQVNSRVTITFHARLESDLSNLRGRLKPFTVITNEGDAFNGTEGQFTAPVNGAYFFVASAGTYSTDKFVRLQLKQEGTTVSETFAQQYSGHDIMGSCHATLRLTVGQRVWLESENSNSHYSQRSTSFTGFLINADD